MQKIKKLVVLTWADVVGVVVMADMADTTDVADGRGRRGNCRGGARTGYGRGMFDAPAKKETV